MKIRVAHHIFASVKGYQTQFCSPKVSDLENAELESFSFGQTNDAKYMASLTGHPAYIVRKLKSGRWAITRVFQGPDDEYSRATLLFHTVLISQDDWIGCLGCDILPILDHSALWQDTNLTSISVELDRSSLPPQIAEDVRLLLAKITSSSSPVVVDESACSLEIVRWVNRLLLDEEKEEFSYGYRVLSDVMDASLLCLSKQALRTSRMGGLQRQPAIPARKKQFDYEQDMSYERQAGMNKVAILIVIAICVLGIAGAIFAFQTHKNIQYKKHVAEVTESAKTFLDENKEFATDANERKKKIEKAQQIVKQISDIQSPNSDSELKSILENLEKWKVEIAETTELYDYVEKLKNRYGREQLDEELLAYPKNDKMKRVQLIENEIKEILGNQVDGSYAQSSMYFKGVRDGLHDELVECIKEIKKWKDDVEGIITTYYDEVVEIENRFESCDLNSYITKDPNEVDFSDPNQPAGVDPREFMDLAKEKIELLERQKKDLSKFRSNSSLSNVANSTILEHKEEAKELEVKLRSLLKRLDQRIATWEDLEGKAGKIKDAENILSSSSSGRMLDAFYKALIEHGWNKKIMLRDIEEGWLRHYKWAIFEFYKERINPNLMVDKYSEATIKKLYKAVDGSSLKSEEAFKDLYNHYKELQEMDNKKTKPAVKQS